MSCLLLYSHSGRTSWTLHPVTGHSVVCGFYIGTHCSYPHPLRLYRGHASPPPFLVPFGSCTPQIFPGPADVNGNAASADTEGQEGRGQPSDGGEDPESQGKDGGGGDADGGNGTFSNNGYAPSASAAAAAAAEGGPHQFRGGFENAADYRGSPLALLKEDPMLWKLGEREPPSVREAAVAVGNAAAAAAAAAVAATTAAATAERVPPPPAAAAEVAAAESSSTPAAGEAGEGVDATATATATATAAVTVTAPQRSRVEMSPEVGRALMRWSDRLREAGRESASLMGLQAVVMGVLSVHRRNVLAGCEPEIAAPAPGGTAAVARRKEGDENYVGGGGRAVEEPRGEATSPAEGRRRGAAGGGGGGEGRGLEENKMFVYGNVARLEADIFAATGVEEAFRLGRQGGLKGSRAVDPAFKISSILRGVPWLSVLDEEGDDDGGSDGSGRLLVWRPPAVVAEALDADLDADPVAWLSGFGRADGNGDEAAGDEPSRRGEEEERVDAGVSTGDLVVKKGAPLPPPLQQQQQHPCLQQLEAYLAHRDDLDFAAGLFRAGFYCSAYLVLGRIVAAAALPEELGATAAVGRRREGRLPALRAGGPPPSWPVLEAEACARPEVRIVVCRSPTEMCAGLPVLIDYSAFRGAMYGWCLSVVGDVDVVGCCFG